MGGGGNKNIFWIVFCVIYVYVDESFDFPLHYISVFLGARNAIFVKFPINWHKTLVLDRKTHHQSRWTAVFWCVSRPSSSSLSGDVAPCYRVGIHAVNRTLDRQSPAPRTGQTVDSYSSDTVKDLSHTNKHLSNIWFNIVLPFLLKVEHQQQKTIVRNKNHIPVINNTK